MKELPVLLDAVGWSARQFARRVGASRPLAGRWSRGEVGVPQPLLQWLARLALWLKENPPPRDWRRTHMQRNKGDV